VPIDVDDVRIELTGTLDRMRVVRLGGGGALSDIRDGGFLSDIDVPTGRKLIDLKSGKNAVNQGVAKVKGHRPQLGTYEILYEAATGLPCTEAPAILGAKTVGTPEIALGDAPGAKELMLGTGPDDPGLIDVAAKMFRSGMFPPNPTSALCDRRFCARWDTCRFHD
jgi:hypothetical protein